MTTARFPPSRFRRVAALVEGARGNGKDTRWAVNDPGTGSATGSFHQDRSRPSAGRADSRQPWLAVSRSTPEVSSWSSSVAPRPWWQPFQTPDLEATAPPQAAYLFGQRALDARAVAAVHLADHRRRPQSAAGAQPRGPRRARPQTAIAITREGVANATAKCAADDLPLTQECPAAAATLHGI